MSKSVKNVQKFLGLANYYRWFVKDFAGVTKPLYEIIMKPVLVTLDLDKEMRVKADVLDFTISGVLSIKYKDEK